jgi:tetratricopeptide (TPR) repeat protein
MLLTNLFKQNYKFPEWDRHKNNVVQANNFIVFINIHFYIKKLPFIFENNIFLPLDFRIIKYTMAKVKKHTQVDNLKEVESVLTTTEQFLEANQKLISIVIGAIVVIAVGYLGLNKFYLEPRSKDAQEQMFKAQNYFEKDSFNLALNGDGSNPGFLDIIDDFGSTDAGNLARYYAGISYLHLGQFENAIDYLKKFDTDDLLLGPISVGAQGDAQLELGKTDKALDLYTEAYKMNNNELTAPIYMLKAGELLEISNKQAEALKIYETIKLKFPESNEGRSIEKYIARAKAKMKS